MEFLVGVLIVVLFVRWLVLNSKFNRLNERLDLAAKQRAADIELISHLTQRVHKLEAGGVVVAPAPSVSMPVPEPVVEKPPAPRVKLCEFCGRVVEANAQRCFCGAWVADRPDEVRPPKLPEVVPVAAAVSIEEPSEVGSRLKPAPQEAVLQEAVLQNRSTSVLRQAVPPPVPQESLRDRLRKSVGDEGWEALVGGNLLNKLGVLLFVIGIALLLGYEFSRVGPMGRVAIGLGVSLTMLIGGVWLETKPIYKVFARGLIGGGWAALYFTTYAMYALPQIRVIENAIVAAVLLLGVAVGMVVHSLKYKSQTVTGLAYFIAFGTLALAENTTFSVLALIPLVASLLVVANRFDWYRMAVFGVIATYATCASRPDTGAPLGTTQALFAMYWLLFEAFDLLSMRRRPLGFTIESAVMPLNALGFLGLSIVKWHRAAHPHLWEFLAAGAAAYLISSLLRARLAPAGFWECQATEDRMAAGGYEGPITLASALAAASIFMKASGAWVNVALLIEGEVLFLAGLRFGQNYLRGLSGAVFGSSMVHLFAVDIPSGGQFELAGRKWSRWDPMMLLTAATFYFNRWRDVVEGWVYSTVAGVLITVVLGFDVYGPYGAVAWMMFAAVLFEFGYRKELREFRYQAYVVGGMGTVIGLLFYLAPPMKNEPYRAWLPLSMMAALNYAITLRVRFGEKKVERWLEWATSSATVAYSMVLTWRVIPGEYLGAAWVVLGAVLFEMGLRKLPAYFRELSYIVSGAGFLNLFVMHVVMAHKGQAWSLGIAAMVSIALSARLFPATRVEISEAARGWTRDLNAAAGTLFVATLAWVMLPAPLVAVAWAAIGVVLLEVGFTWSLVRFRMLGNIAGVAAFGRVFMANFTNLGYTWRVSHRMLTVVPVAVSQYYAWWRYKGSDAEEKGAARVYLYAPAILIVALMRFELGRSLAVVGWALLVVALYQVGLKKKIVDLRWQSYPIAALAFWRCWNTNFYIPESLAGIQGRVLTGAIVIACFYAADVLSPREGGEGWLDRHGRTFYSVLASVLLAVLLFYEVSGGVLTTAWGMEGLALLGSGFPLRDRLQRLSGLFLLMVCVLKLFFYDLRALETVSRILSFIVLGAILIGVSWVYTRFKDRIAKYL